MTKHKSIYTRLLPAILAIALFWPEISHAKIAAGNGALELWNAQGIANSPQWVQYWLIIMMSSFALGLLFIWKHIEARWVVGGLIVGLLFCWFVIFKIYLGKCDGASAIIRLGGFGASNFLVASALSAAEKPPLRKREIALFPLVGLGNIGNTILLHI